MHLKESIALLSHAESDLMLLAKARPTLPDAFPEVVGFNLQTLSSDDDMRQLIQTALAQAKIVVVRVLGPAASVAGIKDLTAHCQNSNCALVVVSGTGDLDPELTCMSNVDPSVIHESLAYFQAGGVVNASQLLRFLADQLLFTGFGYESPLALPEHGIYHPDLADGTTIEDWQERICQRPATIGIAFYRAHWLSGNTQFVDALVRGIERRGMNALPVFTSSLRTTGTSDNQPPPAFRFFLGDNKSRIDALINTTSFAMTDVNDPGQSIRPANANILLALDIPILQGISCGVTQKHWQESARGLNPLDTAMNVVLPEFDGRIVTVPISFKEKNELGQAANYTTIDDRIDRIAGLAWRFSQLRHKANRDKRIAFIFTNASSKASQIGNAVGLDAPASVLQLLRAMWAAGYSMDELPKDGTSLIHELIDRCSYDQTYLSAEQCARAVGRIPAKQYQSWFAELPEQLQEKMGAQWGPPPGEAYVQDNQLIIAGISLGNVVLVLQPPRGYGMDPNAIYHQPDLPPTHHYFALYRWLDEVWNADAIVHVGKHGTLEWLPGKGVGLSARCFPDALLGNLPLFYPFILNDPGEGAQAKRRGHAVIVDHLTPPMTSAETYGLLAELTQLVDEYYQVEMLDPAKLPLLQQQIWDLIRQSNLDKDLKFILEHDNDDDHNHHDEEEDHDHEWDDTLTPHGVPVTLAEMDGVKVSHLIQEIDGYLCELGAAQIRDGLHTLGQAPQDGALIDMLSSLTRLPNLEVPGLQGELAKYLGLEIAELLKEKGARLKGPSDRLSSLAQKPLVTNSDALEFIDFLGHRLFEKLKSYEFDQNRIGETIADVMGTDQNGSGIASILSFACQVLVPNLNRTQEEIGNLLNGLEGRYVPPGPSGAPTRGMAHILPTGRNFYSVDPRSLPSQSAWHVGQQLAREVLQRHVKETAHYPETVAISVWGTSAMRTHGDDVAEVLALMGVRPLWQAENRRLTGIEVIPLSELGRPRIDVTIRISGFFRDAFQHLIDLVDQAVKAVIALDELPEENFVRKHFLEDVARLTGNKVKKEEATNRAAYRIFGAKPGSYGAGILPLINEKNWRDVDDFAETYVNWGGYAYTQTESGAEAKEDFRHRLAKSEIALHNQDNREHDIFDSDDYLQFHGGMIATIQSLTGKRPRHYFGDSSDPGRPLVRDLKEEALRVFRSRVVNPKWIASIQRHGYKGGLELTATVDYLFGYDATSDILDDWMYEEIAQVYALDNKMQDFFSESNPWALNAITERLLEAAERQMWTEPKPSTLSKLRNLYLSSEAELEARGEKPRIAETAK